MENRIAEWRKARGLKQSQLAQLLSGFTGTDVHVTTVSRLETGKLALNEKWLLVLAQALEVQPIELLGRADEQLPAFSTDEATVFTPPEDHPFANMAVGKQQKLYRVISNALDRIGIGPEEIVIADASDKALQSLKTGERQTAPVICRVTRKPTGTITLVRQFVWPSLVIRNCSDGRAGALDLERDNIEIIAVIISSLKQH